MFVDRNGDGLVTGIYACAQREGQEELQDDHADIAAFRDRLVSPEPPTPEQKLAAAGLTVDELKQLLGID